MSRSSVIEVSATMVVFSVIRKVFPVALAELGFGMTRPKAIFASCDVGFDSLQAAIRNVKTINAAQLKYARVKYDGCMVACF